LAALKAAEEFKRRKKDHNGPLSLVPDEKISLNEIRRISVPIYGMKAWEDLFSPRQKLSLSFLVTQIRQLYVGNHIGLKDDFKKAVLTLLSLAIDRQADYLTSLVVWSGDGEFIAHTFGRQAIPMVWEWPECNLWSKASGSWDGAIDWIARVIEANQCDWKNVGISEKASATNHPLPDDSVVAIITDPPYYDAVPYAYLSDFFYVWLKRTIGELQNDLFDSQLAPKENEIVVDRPHKLSTSKKGIEFYETELTKAFSDGRRVCPPEGIGIIVFASKTTASWEAILQAVISAGWTITGSWPIDTEREARVSARGQARLGSSVHLVCRPRENPNGSLRSDYIGEWRDVLQELPERIHDWMPRLAHEGIVGADAIFACLGPALEIFSRYSRIEKASGEQVTLKEYLEHVWAAVAREALNMIFEGADATGFEEDARLTAMWLWTISNGGNGNGIRNGEEEARASTGYILEYDAARKIAQGLGAHLEQLGNLVEIKGDKARLLPVSERNRYLFGKEGNQSSKGKRKKKDKQMKLSFETVIEEAKEHSKLDAKSVSLSGKTVLDRIHQCMILFASGRGEALKRFLVEEGIGRDQRFWRLAQSLSALYPANVDEKRWVDGILSRKKSLVF